jgi:hypothetical protein
MYTFRYLRRRSVEGARILSPDQFLQLETIKMQQQACAKGGCTFLIGGGAVPVFNTK